MKKAIIFCIIYLSLILFLSGCSPKADNPKSLPSRATNIVKLGNNWVTFDLDDSTFLYHKSIPFFKYRSFESITQLRDE
ncbi:unnamed protein product [marine sediment metagenome]|uniref:Uncharacterized protein n=1 Tax=marine sediment metagenome TaxID=412755 RepID=X0W8F1_9ZZZZ